MPQSFAALAHAFAMRVSAFDPFRSEDVVRAAGVAPAGSIEAGLAEADHVSLHLPKSGTRPLSGISAESAMRMSEASARNIVDFFAGTLDPALVVNWFRKDRRDLVFGSAQPTCYYAFEERGMPRPNTADRVSKFQRHRAAKRANGMKLLRLWVRDPFAPGFREEAQRQAERLRASPDEIETLAFIEAASDLDGWR